MSNLTPTPRTDKNGRTVTRWVRSDSSSSPLTTRIPAPAAGAVSIVDQSILELGDLGYDLKSYPLTHDNLKFLSGYDPALLDRVMTSARVADPAGLEVLGQFMQDDLREYYSEYMKPYLPKLKALWYRRATTFPLAPKLHPDVTPKNQIGAIGQLAVNIENMLGLSFSAKDTTRAQAAMIISNIAGRFSFDTDELDFVTENLDRVIPLIPELKKRRNATRSLIESIWENESNALDCGVL